MNRWTQFLKCEPLSPLEYYLFWDWEASQETVSITSPSEGKLNLLHLPVREVGTDNQSSSYCAVPRLCSCEVRRPSTPLCLTQMNTQWWGFSLYQAGNPLKFNFWLVCILLSLSSANHIRETIDVGTLCNKVAYSATSSLICEPLMVPPLILMFLQPHSCFLLVILSLQADCRFFMVRN